MSLTACTDAERSAPVRIASSPSTAPGPRVLRTAVLAVPLRDNAHAPGHDEVEAVAGVTRVEQPFACGNAQRVRGCDELILQAGREQPEER